MDDGQDGREERQAALDGRADGEGVRDLHQNDARATVGGDHRPGAAAEVQLRRRAPSSDWTPGSRYELREPARACSPRARTWRSIPRAGSCRASPRCGARTSEPKGPRASPGRSNRSSDSCRLTVTHDQLAREREQRAVRRLADDPLGAEDAAGERGGADDAGFAAVFELRRLADQLGGADSSLRPGFLAGQRLTSRPRHASCPGSAGPSGSNRRLTASCSSSALSAHCIPSWPLLTVPSPCSPEIEPPRLDRELEQVRRGAFGACDLRAVGRDRPASSSAGCRRRRDPSCTR